MAKLSDLLSKQQQNVLTRASQGLLDQEIARELGLSIDTVRTYWRRIRQKVDSRTRPELARIYEHDLMLAANALREIDLEANETLAVIPEICPTPIMMHTPGLGRTYVNRAWEEMCGISRENAMGYGWVNVLLEEDKPRMNEFYLKCELDGEAFQTECAFKTSDGTKYARVQAVAVIKEDQVVGVVASMQNITTERELQAKLESIGRN